MNKRATAKDGELAALLSQGKRLDELRKALFAGRALTTEERGQMLRYLNAFDALTWTRYRERYPRRGAPPSEAFCDAELARQIVDENGVRIKSAIRALLPAASDKEIRRVARHVSENRKSFPGIYLYVEPRRLDEAIARLPKSLPQKKKQ